VTKPYVATLLQPRTKLVFGADRVVRRDLLRENAEHYAQLIASTEARTDARLYLLPQFAFQGATAGLTVEHWLEAAVRLDGPEIAELARAARSAGAYVAGATCEYSSEYPGRYWHTGFLLAPDGRLVLCARKHYALTTKTRPGDVLDDYVARHGRTSLFPVVDTPLGRLAIVTGNDLAWPEVARCHALKGAELLLNPICAAQLDYLGRPGADAVAAARAYENLAWVLTANVGALDDGTDSPAALLPSRAYDHTGRLAGVADGGPDRRLDVTVDLEALRRTRATPAGNFLAQLVTELHAPEYAQTRLWPANGWRDAPLASGEELVEYERAAWQRMTASGAFAGPSHRAR
jgi:predicted amidohydrolase